MCLWISCSLCVHIRVQTYAGSFFRTTLRRMSSSWTSLPKLWLLQATKQGISLLKWRRFWLTCTWALPKSWSCTTATKVILVRTLLFTKQAMKRQKHIQIFSYIVPRARYPRFLLPIIQFMAYTKQCQELPWILSLGSKILEQYPFLMSPHWAWVNAAFANSPHGSESLAPWRADIYFARTWQRVLAKECLAQTEILSLE